MTFTIEPMINAGKREVTLLPDGWTVITKDRTVIRPVGAYYFGYRNRL